MKEIREWLAGEERDYAAGVALYAAHGRSEVMRKALAYGETDFTRTRLAQALEQLLGPPASVTTNVTTAVTTNVAKTTIVAIPDSSPDPQRRDWFAERNYLHAQLGLVATEAERRELALRILDLGDLIRQSYDQAAGRAPVPPPAGTVPAELAALDDVGEIRRLLANLRPQRSKLKKRPDRADDLATVEASINLLETKLQNHE